MTTKKQSFDHGLDRLASLLWGLALAAIPVTSFPCFPFFGQETQVRPLSIYPMLVLFPILVIQILRKKIKLWNESFTPLIVFIFIVLLTSAAGAFFAPISIRGQDYWERNLRAWISVAVGLMFLLYAIWMNRSEDQLRSSIKWLYIGLILSFLWGGIQILSVTTNWIRLDTIDQWQQHFSIVGFFNHGWRIFGFALEPSWLAGQLATLYLPWIFATLLTGYRVSRYRWLEFSLLGMAGILLIFTFSRGGIALAILAAILTALLTGREGLVRLWQWWTKPLKRDIGLPNRRWREWAPRLAALIFLIAILASSMFVLSRSDYFAQLWRSRKTDLIGYVVDIYAGPRLAYAWAGLKAFGEHPWTGVGLGASGFYMFRFLPDWSRTLIPEIAQLLNPQSSIFPNPKNLYTRLLAETGIFGFAAFLTFYFYTLGKVHALLLHIREEYRFLGVASLFTWIALILYYFTQDSFAMPNMWINVGILLGMADSIPKSKANIQA